MEEFVFLMIPAKWPLSEKDWAFFKNAMRHMFTVLSLAKIFAFLSEVKVTCRGLEPCNILTKTSKWRGQSLEGISLPPQKCFLLLLRSHNQTGILYWYQGESRCDYRCSCLWRFKPRGISNVYFEIKFQYCLWSIFCYASLAVSLNECINHNNWQLRTYK